MAVAREYAGLGRGDALVKPVAGANLSTVRLTAQEGFVYSRVDGTLTLEALCLVTGLGEEATAEILRRLSSLGLIEVGGRPAARPTRLSAEQRAVSRVSPAAPPREESRPAERPQPERPFRRRPPSDETERTTIPVQRRSPSGEATFPPEQTGPTPKPKPRAVELPADETGIDLKPEQRLRIREIFATLQEKTFFDLLEVSPHADTTELKRAYFLRSKEFHPDRYFTKKLGAYKEMLDEIFKQVSAAYRFLEDEEQRGSYREMVLQDMEQASALRQVEEQAARAIVDDAGEQAPPAVLAAENEGAEPDGGHEYRMSRSDLHRAVSDERPRVDRPRRPSPFAPKLPTPLAARVADETSSYAKLSPEEREERERLKVRHEKSGAGDAEIPNEECCRHRKNKERKISKHQKRACCSARHRNLGSVLQVTIRNKRGHGKSKKAVA